jgi:hypothetical protein
VGRDGTLAEVLANYRRWLFDALGHTNVRTLMADGEAFSGNIRDGSVLGCWWLDKPFAGRGEEQCRCDAIAKAWAQMHHDSIKRPTTFIARVGIYAISTGPC